MKVEICANSYESALIAQEGGAHRIELCEDLSVGGITPSRNLIKKVIDKLEIPIHVLIRPRSGNFCYSETELETMKDDIDFCKDIGCDGIVSGVLTEEKKIDVIATDFLIQIAPEMEFTFHRAFDVCDSPFSALDNILNLNISRLLSSGQQPNALKGLSLLKKMKEIAAERIEIMPGAGINDTNYIHFKDADFESIHLSAIVKENNCSTELFNKTISGNSNLEMIKIIVEGIKTI